MMPDDPEDVAAGGFEGIGEPVDLEPHLLDPEPFLPRSNRVTIAWRVVGVLAVLAMLSVPLFNLVDNSQPQIADNGLEVCRVDYCLVEQKVLDEGLGSVMVEMAGRIVPDADVQSFVDAMVDVVGGPTVSAMVVDDLPGDLGGRYSSVNRSIEIDRPATVWVIAHEVSHTVSRGHGQAFQEALVELARFLDRNER